MRHVEMTFRGVNNMPTWLATQAILVEMLGVEGKLTRIARSDNKSNYRALGEYQVTFTPTTGDDVHVTILAKREV